MIYTQRANFISIQQTHKSTRTAKKTQHDFLCWTEFGLGKEDTRGQSFAGNCDCSHYSLSTYLKVAKVLDLYVSV